MMTKAGEVARVLQEHGDVVVDVNTHPKAASLTVTWDAGTPTGAELGMHLQALDDEMQVRAYAQRYDIAPEALAVFLAARRSEQ